MAETSIRCVRFGNRMLAATNVVPVTVDRMLLEWAIAEVHEWRLMAPATLCKKIDAGQPLIAAEIDAAIRAFAQIERRGPEVTFFRSKRFEWFVGDFALDALGDVILHKHWALNFPKQHGWTEPYPRTVREFAMHPEAQKEFQSTKTLDDMRGLPTYVSDRDCGPWHIAEGSHRSDAIWRAHEAGDPRCQGSIEVIVGVHPDVVEWWNFVQ